MCSTAGGRSPSAPSTGSSRCRRAPSSWRRSGSRDRIWAPWACWAPPGWTTRAPWPPCTWWGSDWASILRRGTMSITDEIGDFYELLGVGRDASEEDIKRAYRARARELHPDTNHGNPEAEARFKQVTVAYEVLRDPERRARYDRYGPEGVFGSQAGAGGFNFEGGLSDIFEAFFGSMGGAAPRRRGPQPGSDAEVRVDLEFAEAVFGCRKEISVRLPKTCASC